MPKTQCRSGTNTDIVTTSDDSIGTSILWDRQFSELIFCVI